MSVASLLITATSTRFHADTGTCGGQSITLPFTDVPAGNIFFCSIAEAFFSGLTNGSSPTTYSPADAVSRDQMSAFITRTLDQSIKRNSRRAALRQLWTPQSLSALGLTDIGGNALSVKSDGSDLWTANSASGTVSRVRASDGKLLETWTGATSARAVLCALGRIYVTGFTSPGRLYEINPTQPAGAVNTITSSLGSFPNDIACDGSRIWIPNRNEVEIVSLNPTSVAAVTVGIANAQGILFDGSNIWITDADGSLKKLDSNGAVVTSVNLGPGAFPGSPVFDGSNIWVPNNGNSTLTVVRASSATILATLSGNGLSSPIQAAFDGERILVTDLDGVSLFQASTFAPLGSFFSGTNIFPFGVCSDGVNFWFPISPGRSKLARF